MREIAGFIEVSPGFWIPKPPTPMTPAPVEKPEPKPSRENMASILAAVGVYTDTSIATPSDIAEERARKKREHGDLLKKLQDKREAEAEAEAKTELETLLPIKHGQVDHRFLEVLKCIWARNPDGSTNYRGTLKARQQYLDEFEWRIQRGLPTTPEGA
jgi:hypothetical protein